MQRSLRPGSDLARFAFRSASRTPTTCSRTSAGRSPPRRRADAMDFVVDGKRIYAYTAGRKLDAKLPSVVFVHGAANDHSALLLQTRYFAYHGCNALAF